MRQLWQMSTVRGLAIIAIAGALLGCSNVDSAPPQVTAEAQAETGSLIAEMETKKNVANSKFITDTKLYEEQAIDFSKFTIERKSAKKISTPKGNVEIYDPINDNYVRSRFKMYMQSNFPPQSPLRMDLNRLNEIILNEYRKNYCSSVTDGNCFTWDYKGCEGPPPYDCSPLPPGAVMKYTCPLNGHNHDVRDYKTKRTLDEAMSKYFEFECHEWKK